MDNRKRVKEWLKKSVSLLLTLAILTPLCIVPARAGEKFGSGDYSIQFNFTVGLNAGFGYYYGSDPYQFLQTVYYDGSLTQEEVADLALVVARRYAISYYGSVLFDALYTHEVVGCSAGSLNADSGWSDGSYGNFRLYWRLHG